MCLVIVQSRNFTVWRHKWIPCGVSRGVEMLRLREAQSRGKVTPTGLCRWGGFPATTSPPPHPPTLLSVEGGGKSSQPSTAMWTYFSLLHGGKTESCHTVRCEHSVGHSATMPRWGSGAVPFGKLFAVTAPCPDAVWSHCLKCRFIFNQPILYFIFSLFLVIFVQHVWSSL